MTDITRLTQEMKAAAEKAKHAGEAPVMPFDTWISMLNKYQITVCPDNILALVAALELKEEQRANWFHMAQKLGNNLDAAEKRIAELEREPAARMVVTPTIWKHYTAAQTAIIYEKAMTDAGIKWRSIDERLTHEELESLYLAMKSHFEVMAESASEAEVIECSQIVRALCELQERRTTMLAVAPQEVK